MAIKPGTAVVIEWLDAVAGPGDVHDEWMQDIIRDGGIPTRSAGLLVKKTRRCIVIAQTQFRDKTIRTALCIPRGMVKKVTVLE